MGALSEQLSDELAVRLRVIGPAGERALAVPRAIGNEQMESLVDQRLLRWEVVSAAAFRSLHTTMDEDDFFACMTPMRDVQCDHRRRLQSRCLKRSMRFRFLP